MNKSKTRGKITMFAGLVLVLASLFLTLYNNYSENNAAKESAKVLLQIPVSVNSDTNETPDYLIIPDVEMARKKIDGKYYVGTLSIPALNLKLPVIDEWSYENFRTAPCVYEGTPYKNNLIICAHNYRKHFRALRSLVPGDKVTFNDMEGNVFIYEVMYTELLDDEAVEEMSSGEWDLTLFTCTYGGATRITVRCKNVEL